MALRNVSVAKRLGIGFGLVSVLLRVSRDKARNST